VFNIMGKGLEQSYSQHEPIARLRTNAPAQNWVQPRKSQGYQQKGVHTHVSSAKSLNFVTNRTSLGIYIKQEYMYDAARPLLVPVSVISMVVSNLHITTSLGSA
jgi:hypothetical protein